MNPRYFIRNYRSLTIGHYESVCDKQISAEHPDDRTCSELIIPTKNLKKKKDIWSKTKASGLFAKNPLNIPSPRICAAHPVFITDINKALRIQ